MVSKNRSIASTNKCECNSSCHPFSRFQLAGAQRTFDAKFKTRRGGWIKFCMVRKIPFEILGQGHLSDFKRKFESEARFLVDESVGLETARLIRDRGWNVRYVDDLGLLDRSHEEILAFARREQRILLTHHFDFLDDNRFPFHRNPGLVVLPPATCSTLGLADAINGVLALIGPYFKAFRGYKIRITEDGVWTIRCFNTEEGIHQEIRVKFGKIK